MKRERKVRVGVIGLGRIGWEHGKNLHRHRDFILAAVADREESRCQEARDLFGCPSYQDYAEMLALAALDAVVIASPTHLHKEMALAAFARKRHVFLEKPMALTVAEAQTIVRTAKRVRRVLTVYQPHRASAYFQQLRKILATGMLGAIYHVRRGDFSFARRNDWQALQRYGGGMLRNYGAHAIDELLVLTGYDIKRVFCDLRRVASLGDADDVVKIIYETRNGRLGEVDINQALVAKPYAMEVYGTRGAALLQGSGLEGYRWLIRALPSKAFAPKRLDPALAAANRQYPWDNVKIREKTIPVNPRDKVDVYADFAHAIRTGAAPFVKPCETLAVMQMIEQCSLASGEIQATSL